MIGAGIGYQFYLFEESGPERYKELIKQHKNAPWFEKGVLLARREARMKAQEGGNEETENALAGWVLFLYHSLSIVSSSFQKYNSRND